ncbi:hypothetical protein NDU88_002703, partial [Pleurodeles waltl]
SLSATLSASKTQSLYDSTSSPPQRVLRSPYLLPAPASASLPLSCTQAISR